MTFNREHGVVLLEGDLCGAAKEDHGIKERVRVK